MEAPGELHEYGGGACRELFWIAVLAGAPHRRIHGPAVRTGQMYQTR